MHTRSPTTTTSPEKNRKKIFETVRVPVKNEQSGTTKKSSRNVKIQQKKGQPRRSWLDQIEDIGSNLYYGGEALSNIEQPQAYTCPYCSRMGFTDSTLQEHVASDHAETSFEVVCPVCAAIPGGDPNLMTDDFAGHLTLEHRTGPRELISFLDEPVATRVHNVRRIPHSGHLASGSRTSQSGRPRRSNMHFSTGALSSLSPSSRDSVDPIAELLSQLSGVRRTANNTSSSSSSTPSQLQQLQMQLQLERQQVSATRQQLERFPRRQNQSQTAAREASSNADSTNSPYLMLKPAVTLAQPSTTLSTPTLSSNFLLAGLLEEHSLQNATEDTRSDRSQFVQQLVLSTTVRRKDEVKTPQLHDNLYENLNFELTC
ncbi:hypothetical protein FQR65_LT10148 [Abscondita terminalis]|nr:hypothetical protein FQR65_LT10148 [Abscondita terminalis]